MNKVLLQGRLATDPATATAGQTTVTRFNLAVERRFQKDKTNREADFIRCCAWGKYPGDFIANNFVKGGWITVIGRLETGSYDDKNNPGKKIYTTEIVVEEAYFGGSAKPSGKQSTQAPQATSTQDAEFFPVEDDELPFN